MAGSSDLDAVLDGLRARGEHVTTARRAVLIELFEADSQHLSAEALARRVNQHHPDVHLSTVYRTLDFLEHAGVLVQVRLGSGPGVYHFATESHHHAICDQCGATIELPGRVLAPVTASLRRDYGFEAHPRHLAIGGLCAACAAR